MRAGHRPGRWVPGSIMNRAAAGALLALALLPPAAVGSALAAGEELQLRRSLAAGDPSPAACEGRAALYAASGTRVWVTRHGRMREDNPLRPLSQDAVSVLQVVVNGRSATAFGPDFENMRQGAAAARLEEASGHPIVWRPALDELPGSFRIVAEDGRVLLGPLTFSACADIPGVAPERPQARPRTPSREELRDPAAASRPGLPQGAIPSGGKGGLSLPQP